MPRRAPADRAKPRRTPRQARSAHLAEAVVEASARVLEKRGPGGLNTNAVAERAGVSVGSLYQYFLGKEALVAALLRRERDALVARVAAAVDAAEGLPLADGLARLAAVAADQQALREGLARELDRIERSPPLNAEARGGAEALERELARFFAPHAAAIAPLDPAAAAGDALAIARGLTDRAAERGAVDRAALGAAVLRALTGYLLGAKLHV